MPDVDYYRILGVASSATQSEIRRSFRVLALRLHPDQNRDDPAAEERFKLITQAYKILLDPRRRAQYDRTLEASAGARRREAEERRRKAQRSGAGTAQKNDSEYGRSFVKKEEPPRKKKPWWEEEFQRFKTHTPLRTKSAAKARKPAPAPPERDIHVDMKISDETAAYGGTQPLAITRDTPCSVCEGTGARAGTNIRRCPECDPKAPRNECVYCHGRGQIVQSPCTKCHGEGSVRERNTAMVRIPIGAKNNQELRIKGEGRTLKGQPPGDLYVRLHIRTDTPYERREESVYSQIHITPAMAAMGGRLRVKTVDSSVELVVPPGTKAGTVFKLEGVGPHLKEGGRGDHFVTIDIVHV